MGQAKIVVSEIAANGVQRVQALRCGDKLVLMIDDQPFQLDMDRATALAWSIRTQVDAMRTEQIERAVSHGSSEADRAAVLSLAA